MGSLYGNRHQNASDPNRFYSLQAAVTPVTQKRLTIEQADPLLLFGSNDTHLRRVEAAFPNAQILARGNQIILKGTRHAVASVERTLQEMIVVINRHGSLTTNDVDTVLALVTSERRSPETTSDLGEVVLFTPSEGMVRAKTPGQTRLVTAARRSDIVFAIGPAGTGKTFMAVALGVAALKARHVKRIVLCRPAVEAGERLGFLPGDFRDKIDPYLRPLYDALEEMLPLEKLGAHMEQHVIEIVPLAFMRGRTLNSAFVILDEAQNATSTQMKMFLTRLGINSRAIVTGDLTQIDLDSRQNSGLVEAQKILMGIDGIEFISFDKRDVVRHRLVKDIIDAYGRHDEENGHS